MKKSLVVVLLLFMFGCNFAYRRRHSYVLRQVAKFKELFTENNRLIDEEVDGTEEENKRLQASANNINLFLQDATYLFYKSIDNLQDPELRKIFIALIKPGGAYAYNIGKTVNGDSVQIKTALKQSIQDYMSVILKAKGIFEHPAINKENLQVVINEAREAYDLGLFNCYVISVEMVYRKKPNKVIGGEIEKSLEKTYILLNKIKLESRELSIELVIFSHYIGHLTDRIVSKVERLAHLWKSQGFRDQSISGVSQKLGKIVGELRKGSATNTTTISLKNGLEAFLHGASIEIKKLADTDDTSFKHYEDIFKDILLECLTTVLTLKTKLELILTEI